MSERSSGNPISFLYNHNPFYLFSTLAVLYSLHVWQTTGNWSANHSPSSMAWVLIGFIVVLTVVGFAVVRFGGVWEDARSIFLSILLIAFAVSVSLDHLCVVDSRTAFLCIAMAYAFLAIITEVILRGLKIRMPPRYRFSYYLILAVLFFYPLIFAPGIFGMIGTEKAWLIYGFSVLSSLAILTLICPISLGENYIKNNGTPWNWPAYPWSVFAFLVAAVCLRTYTLCLSFLPQYGIQSGFSLFYLTPVVFALLGLWLHATVCADNKELQGTVLFFAGPLVMLTTLSLDTGYQANEFRSLFTNTIGSPIWIGIAGLTLFYAIAWIRGAIGGHGWFVASLIFLSFVPERVTHPTGFELTNWFPLALAASLLLARSIDERSTRLAAGSLVPLGMAVQLLLTQRLDPSFPALFTVAGYLFAVLTLSVVMKDRWAHIFRLAYAIAIPIFLVWLIVVSLQSSLDFNIAVITCGVLTLTCFIVYEMTKTKIYLPTSILCLMMSLLCGSSYYMNALIEIPQGSRIGLLISVVFLFTGSAISLAKAGCLNPIRRNLQLAWADSIEAIRRSAALDRRRKRVRELARH